MMVMLYSFCFKRRYSLGQKSMKYFICKESVLVKSYKISIVLFRNIIEYVT